MTLKNCGYPPLCWQNAQAGISRSRATIKSFMESPSFEFQAVESQQASGWKEFRASERTGGYYLKYRRQIGKAQALVIALESEYL